jgi:ribosomal protein S18 acetylase RimI-like enzyme
MLTVRYELASESDIPQLARIRAADWETESYWNARISGYLSCELHPKESLLPRILYMARANDTILGFIAGHLTLRYDCDGELEWIDVIPEYRHRGIGSKLFRLLSTWYVEQKAHRICVDVDPANRIARNFYRALGAEDLNKHWMMWKEIRSVMDKLDGK